VIGLDNRQIVAQRLRRLLDSQGHRTT